jgi:hypothetical protein
MYSRYTGDNDDDDDGDGDDVGNIDDGCDGDGKKITMLIVIQNYGKFGDVMMVILVTLTTMMVKWWPIDEVNGHSSLGNKPKHLPTPLV